MDKNEYMRKTNYIIEHSKDSKKIKLAKQVLEKLQFSETDIQKLPSKVQEDGFGIPFQNQFEWINSEYECMTTENAKENKNGIFKRFFQLFKRK